jgi:hypothetical protein
MVTKSDQHKVMLTGPGLSFERPISEQVANRIISLVMTGAEATSDTSFSGIDTRGPAPSAEITPKQFIAQKRPSNDYERVTCLAYYLTHRRNSPQFKTRDITKLSTEAALHVSNLSQAVGHATTRHHFLASAGRGAKQITTLGEAVAEALPDQERVKAVIREHKPGRRRKKRRVKRQ